MTDYSRRTFVSATTCTSTVFAYAAFAGLLASPALAATTTNFAPTLQVNGLTLQLNGAGTRYKAIFKVYDMAMYTQRKVSTPAEALVLNGPVRLGFVTLREISGTELGRLFLRGMSDNSPREAVNRHTVASGRLIDIFSGRPRLLPGDSFAMEFVPGKGTSFFIGQEVQGNPVGDAEFFRMVLSIWLGQAPADFLLKDALLGLK
ncbi:MAG: chalcone isomerase family protein [Pseudomonadota bacterium]